MLRVSQAEGGEGKVRAKASANANVATIAKDAGVQNEEKLLNHSQVCDGERMVDEGGGGNDDVRR